MKRVIYLVFIILLFMPLRGLAEEIYRVEHIELIGQLGVESQEVLELFGIKPPAEVTIHDIDRGIKRLYRKGLFEDIKVDYNREKAVLTLTLKQKRFIGSIKIKGNRFVSTDDILQVIEIKEDRPYEPVKLKTEEIRLKRYLKTRGFPEAEVHTEARETAMGWVDLYFFIKEGNPIRIKTITIRGYPQRLKAEMKIQAGDIYDLKALDEEIKHLKEYFRKKGYIGTVVGPFTFYRGELILNIKAGERIQLIFKGNHEFGDDELEEISELRELQRIGSEEIDIATEQMLEAYKRRGYLDVQIAPVVEGDENGKRITFFVYEGKRYRLKEIVFSGTSIPIERFKDIMNLKQGGIFSQETLEADLNRIISFYNSLGYLNAVVEERDVKKDKEEALVTVKVAIKEGKRYRVGDIRIRGNSFYTKERILKYLSLKRGDYYNEVELFSSRIAILNSYRMDGFSDAKVSVTTELGDHTVNIHIDIREGRRYRLGKIILRGNLRTDRRVILREIDMLEGEPLNLTGIAEIQRRLYRLGLFSDVNVRAVNYADGIKDLLIEVKEAAHGMLEYGFGFGEYEGPRVMADFSYSNISGMNRRLRLRLEGSSVKKRFFANLQEPYWWGRGTTLNGVLQYVELKRKDFDTGDILYKVRKYSAELLGEKELTKNIKVFLAYNYSLVKTFDVKPDVVLSKEDTGTLGISSIRPGIIYDSRDHPFEPKKGMVLGLSLKLSSGYLLSETDFYKINISTSYYRAINSWLTLALSFRGGFAQGFGDTKELPITERFFLGGRNTVRGFAQDSLGPKGEDNSPTGGNAFLAGNLEFRVRAWKGLGFVLFLDSGNVWQRIKDVDLRMRYTAGVGLRYSTPVGPIRIDYGHKLDRREGESSGEIHFSIGHAF
ncbi:MAG: outer membrane protein assembly factor BamA [Nitrospirae bacterium]|nr:MAG: outer membrane protein assembly factor BamA [Nitrospirota bacterium]